MSGAQDISRGAISITSSNPSNHSSNAQVLQARGFVYNWTESESDGESFETVWDVCRGLLGVDMPHVEALAMFDTALSDNYESELQFDRTLLNVWKEVLGEQHEEGRRVFLGRNDGPDIGIVSQVRKSVLFDNKSIPSHNASKHAKTDHATVVFHDGTNPTIRDCTAVVELKTDVTNCRTLKVYAEGVYDKPDLAKDHAALGQALAYNASHVLHCLRRNGVQDVMTLPLLTVACRTKETRKAKDSPYCMVRGEITLPTTIGEQFSYAMKEVVEFESDRWQERAATAYVKVMTEGLRLAERIRNRVQLPLEKPALLCGQQLIYNGRLYPCEVVGCPIPHPRKDVKVYGDLDFTVRQGELVRCPPLPIGESENEANRQSEEEEYTTEFDGSVLIKVTCPAVHEYLIHPERASAAIDRVQGKHPTALEEVLRTSVCHDESGTLVTIQHDMRAKGYNDFMPKSMCAGRKSVVWEAMKELVERVLRPMAKCGVIHADLRFGWERTYNVVASPTLKLQIIDLESLTGTLEGFATGTGTFSFQMLQGTVPRGDREKKALGFLWWQLVIAGVAWGFEKDDVDAGMTILALNRMWNTKKRPHSDAFAWLAKSGYTAKLGKIFEEGSLGTDEAINQLLALDFDDASLFPSTQVSNVEEFDEEVCFACGCNTL